jgi:hypothetical protein
VLHVFHLRLHALWRAIQPAGAVGLLSAWGFGVPVVVLVSSALNSSSTYIGSPFQNFAVFPFLLFGTVTIVVWLVLRLRERWTLPALAGAIVIAIALMTGVGSSTAIVRGAMSTGATAGQAAVLRSVLQQTPEDAEVVSSVRVVGRFGGRKWVFVLLPSTTAVPINTRDLVVVVAVTSGIEATSTERAAVIDSIFRKHFHAQVLADSHGIHAFRLLVPRRLSQIDLTG